MSTSKEARYKQMLQRERRKSRKRDAALEEAVRQLEEHEAAAAPDASKLQEKLQALNERLYRSAWESEAIKAGANPKGLDDLWKLDPPKIGDGDPDAEKIAKHVKGSLKSRPAYLKPADEETEGDDDDEEIEDAEDEGDGDGDEEVSSVFDLAKPAKSARGKAPESSETSKGKKPGATGKAGEAQTKLGKGAGSGRGGRDDHREADADEIIDRDFAATGRTDAFRI